MLDDILQKRIRLIDYERIVMTTMLVWWGRQICWHAGMVDSLAGIGDRLLALSCHAFSVFQLLTITLTAHAKRAARCWSPIAEQECPSICIRLRFRLWAAASSGSGVCVFCLRSVCLLCCSSFFVLLPCCRMICLFVLVCAVADAFGICPHRSA